MPFIDLLCSKLNHTKFPRLHEIIECTQWHSIALSAIFLILHYNNIILMFVKNLVLLEALVIIRQLHNKLGILNKGMKSPYLSQRKISVITKIRFFLTIVQLIKKRKSKKNWMKRQQQSK